MAGRPGPKSAPGKDAARPRILELRAAGHSIDEIAQALAAEGRPLNRTGIAEVIAAEGCRGCGAAPTLSAAVRRGRSRPALRRWTSPPSPSAARPGLAGCCSRCRT